MDLLNVEAQISHSLFQAFEGNHHFCLDLDSVFIVALIEDIFGASEIAHLLVKVSSGQLLIVFVGVVWLNISWVIVVARIGLGVSLWLICCN